jgi:hypothetical protein
MSSKEMSDKDKNFTGSIPDIYDEFLVPLIFDSYARDMAQRVAEVSPLAVPQSATLSRPINWDRFWDHS